MTTAAVETLIQQVKPIVESAGVFGPVSIREGQLVCAARDAAAPASYRLLADGGQVWVSLVMADRWLSESIEADLMHTGDHVEDLLEEELVDLGAPVTRLKVEHFRSDDLLFTFRSPLPPDQGGDQAHGAATFLLAYEACFRNLGDMGDSGEE